jgi:hypothetical protein
LHVEILDRGHPSLRRPLPGLHATTLAPGERSIVEPSPAVRDRGIG